MTAISVPTAKDPLATLREDARALQSTALFSPAPTDGDDFINGDGADDLIRALGGLDSVFGRGGDDRIFGDAGQDHLFGNLGRDRLFGGADPDVLNGGNGIDRLEGGRDDDFLWGNAGADKFIFRAATGFEGDDTVQDFELGKDKVVLVGFTDGLDGVQVQDEGGTAVLRLLETGTFIRLNGATFAAVSEALSTVVAFA